MALTSTRDLYLESNGVQAIFLFLLLAERGEKTSFYFAEKCRNIFKEKNSFKKTKGVY